jgi:hypothetical protein
MPIETVLSDCKNGFYVGLLAIPAAGLDGELDPLVTEI